MDVVDEKLPLVDTFRASSVGISLVLARSRGVPYRTVPKKPTWPRELSPSFTRSLLLVTNTSSSNFFSVSPGRRQPCRVIDRSRLLK